jgi:hypothetical protein
LNVGEYLELLRSAGIDLERLPPLQPRWQRRIWERCERGARVAKSACAADDVHSEGASR